MYEKLEREFGIATKGIEGWTVGNYKRLRELSLTGRFSGTVAFATVTAVAVGAISLLRHNRNTLNAIDDKIDALHESVAQQQGQPAW